MINLFEKNYLMKKMHTYRCVSMITGVIFLSSFIKFITTNAFQNSFIRFSSFFVWIITLCFTIRSFEIYLKLKTKIKKREYYYIEEI